MSKSLFLNQSTDSKSVFNPVIGAGNLSLIDEVNYDYLITLDNFYAINAAEGAFEGIPTGFQFYLNLYAALNNIYVQTTDYRMTMLMKLILSLLTAAYNTGQLNGSNLLLAVDKINLQKQIQDILSNKNVKNIDTVGGTGQMSVVKSFKLAPVYNYYITVYGMPQNGAGFDPIKLSYLANVLTLNNINPYK
jgi:hypothetical protein